MGAETDDKEKPVYEVTKNVTDADRTSERILEQYQAAKAQRIAQEAGQTGFFRNKYIDPEAAKELPQREGVHAIGKVGIFNVWNGTAPEFPFAAWAKQHEPSVNTKLMEHHANINWNTPEADPRIQRNLESQFGDFLNKGIYGEGAEKFGSVGMVNDILSKGYANDNPNEKTWFDKVHKQLSVYEAGAGLSQDIKKEDEKVNDPEHPLEVGKDYRKLMNDYVNIYGGKIDENSYDELLKVKKGLEDAVDISTLAKKYAPEGFKWGSSNFVEATKYQETDAQGNVIKDKNGNPILKELPGAYSNFKVENGKGEVTMDNDQFKQVVDNMNNELKNRGKSFGVPIGEEGSEQEKNNDEKRKLKIAEYLKGVSSKQTTETISRKADTNVSVNTGAQQVGSIIKAKGETRTFGTGDNAFDQTAVSAYKINDGVKLEGLGNQHNVITNSTGKGGVANLDGATIGNIENRYVKIVDGQVVMTNETGDDVMLAPMAAGEKPVYKEVDVGKPVPDKKTGVMGKQQTKPVKTDETEDFLMPSSFVGSGATPEFLATQRSAYNEAMAYNKEHTSKKTQEQFQKIFGQTEVDVNKDKKTKNVSTTPNTPNPGYTYNTNK